MLRACRALCARCAPLTRMITLAPLLPRISAAACAPLFRLPLTALRIKSAGNRARINNDRARAYQRAAQNKAYARHKRARGMA